MITKIIRIIRDGFCHGEVAVSYPKDATTESQHITRLFRINRLLPIGHRVRGDVA